MRPSRFGAGADRLGGLDRPTADEDRQPSEEGALIGVQQPVTPVHSGPKCALPLGQVGVVAAQIEPVAEPLQQHRRRQHPGPGSHQLDRQRNAVEAAADLGHSRGVLSRQRETRPRLGRAGQEQLHGR